LGPALVALPFIGLIDLTARAITPMADFQLPVPRWATRWRHHFDSTGDINVDFWIRPQQRIAAFLVALTAAFLFLLSLQFLSPVRALLLAAVVGVATPALSTASRALWQHAPSMLFLTLTLWFLLLARKRTAWLAWAGLTVALSYLMRPTNSISVLLLGVYVLATQPRSSWLFFCGGLAVAVPWILINLHTYGTPLPPYYSPALLAGERHWASALAGTLISPSRGLFVFVPVLLFSIVGLWLKVQQRKIDGLDLVLVSILLCHWILISSFPIWWGGHSFGPRYFTDVLPYFFFLMIPAISALRWDSFPSRAVTLLFVALTLFGAAIHLRAAISWAPWTWNGDPVNADAARAWDWKDPQFLRRVNAPVKSGA
jgi:hypothetical protein